MKCSVKNLMVRAGLEPRECQHDMYTEAMLFTAEPGDSDIGGIPNVTPAFNLGVLYSVILRLSYTVFFLR